MSQRVFKKVLGEKATRLINLGATVFVSAASKDGKVNDIMAAAWNCPLLTDPCRAIVVLDKTHFTTDLVYDSNHFCLSVPSAKACDDLLYVGSISKHDDANKLDKLKGRTIRLEGIPMDLPDNCIGHLYFKRLPNLELEKEHEIFIGELEIAYADEAVFKDGHFNIDPNNDEHVTLHYVAGNHFYKLGAPLQAKEL